MSDSFDINVVDRFAVDTIGEPGHRVFLIQIEGEGQLRTLKTEKQAVAALGESITELLEDISDFGHLPDDLDLTGPLDVSWNTGAMSVNWDATIQRFSIEIGSSQWETATLPDDAEDSLASFRITKEQAAAFAIKARLLVEAGRPPCPLCGYPLEDNHACPRTNGHRPPTL